MSRVLVITADFVQQKMAGPAIRAMELSRQLHRAGHDVTLAFPNATDIDPEPYRMEQYDYHRLERLAAGQDVILFQGWTLESYPFLLRSGGRLVVDLYGPFLLELLVAREHDPEPALLADPTGTLLVTNEQVRRGDFFICASEKQRDYWLGVLTALNRVNPQSYEADPSLRSLIDIVPFGLPEEPPRKQAPAIRGVIPGIGDDDLVLLWGSAIYNWFDPLTLIDAVAAAATNIPNLRLVVMATSHPNPNVMQSSMEQRAMQKAKDLGVLGRHVFFNDGWVPYQSRMDWLLESDVGVSINLEHVEARFSFRTRFLDYFWAGLPILCTAGDTLADSVAAGSLGLTVPPGDREALVAAIECFAEPDFRRRCADAVARHREHLTWREAARPLLDFCAQPRRAPDLASLPMGRARPVPVREDADRSRFDWRRLAMRTVESTLYEGPVGLASRTSSYVRRRFSRPQAGR